MWNIGPLFASTVWFVPFWVKLFLLRSKSQPPEVKSDLSGKLWSQKVSKRVWMAAGCVKHIAVANALCFSTLYYTAWQPSNRSAIALSACWNSFSCIMATAFVYFGNFLFVFCPLCLLISHIFGVHYVVYAPLFLWFCFRFSPLCWVFWGFSNRCLMFAALRSCRGLHRQKVRGDTSLKVNDAYAVRCEYVTYEYARRS